MPSNSRGWAYIPDNQSHGRVYGRHRADDSARLVGAADDLFPEIRGKIDESPAPCCVSSQAMLRQTRVLIVPPVFVGRRSTPWRSWPRSKQRFFPGCDFFPPCPADPSLRCDRAYAAGPPPGLHRSDRPPRRTLLRCAPDDRRKRQNRARKKNALARIRGAGRSRYRNPRRTGNSANNQAPMRCTDMREITRKIRPP